MLTICPDPEPQPEPEHELGVYNPDYDPLTVDIHTEAAGDETRIIDNRDGTIIGTCTSVDDHHDAYLALFHVPQPKFVYVPDTELHSIP